MRSLEFNLENGTLIGFSLGLTAGILLLILTGGKFGLVRVILYILASLLGIIAFSVYSSKEKKDLSAVIIMVIAATVMLFVLPVGIIINVGVLVGSGMLLLKILFKLQD